jgi:uncharacterized protein
VKAAQLRLRARVSILSGGLAWPVGGCRRLIQVTPQEEQLLNSLVERVNQTQLQEKDPDAEALVNKAFGSNPDAFYILAQTVLVQNIALEQAQAQVGQLQQQVQQAQQQARQPARATSFLGNLLGHHDPPPPLAQPQAGYAPPPPPPVYAQPQYQQPQYAAVAAGPPSFMRGAMQTAAGVAAGALAFEGVEAVLHGLGGFGHSGFGWGGPGMGLGGMGMGPGMGMMGAGFERPAGETVVNNYYDQPGGSRESFSQGGFAPGGEERHFRESSDASSGQGGAQLSDASYNTADDNQGSYDTDGGSGDSSGGSGDSGGDSGGFDNSGQDDGSGYDGGSGFDSGGGGGDLS